MFVKPGEVVEQRDHETMHDFTVRIEKAAVFRSLENLMTFPFVRTPSSAASCICTAPISASRGLTAVLDQAAKEFRSAGESSANRE